MPMREGRRNAPLIELDPNLTLATTKDLRSDGVVILILIPTPVARHSGKGCLCAQTPSRLIHDPAGTARAQRYRSTKEHGM